MYHIAVIGAGQLGRRHLQGLCGLPEYCKLYAVDPVEESLSLVRESLMDVARKPKIRDIITCTQIEQLPDKLDFAVIATLANVRLQVLEKLLSHCEIGYLLLEKILFQKIEEYDIAERLLTRLNVPTWVNCPRRVYDVYQDVHDFFQDAPITYLKVEGGGWGVGCNGIHFADLFNFLSGKIAQDFDIAQLHFATYPSRRPGCVEFSGRLMGQADGAFLELISDFTSSQRHLIFLRNNTRFCLIDEMAGQAWFMDESQGWRHKSFSMPYQSQLTDKVSLSILQNGTCELPNYQTAMQVHIPLLESLLQHYVATTDAGAQLCPIT